MKYWLTVPHFIFKYRENYVYTILNLKTELNQYMQDIKIEDTRHCFLTIDILFVRFRHEV